MARQPNSFNRAKPRYKPQPTILIICEDSKSGLNYLKDASEHFRVEAQIEILHCGKTHPMGIIEEALERETKFDQVYCVIDRDNQPRFEEAITLAKKSQKVCVIASFPCFEFWLLLHFGHCRKPYSSIGNNSSADLLIKDLCKNSILEQYNKGNEQQIFKLLLGEKFTLARSLSPKVLAEAIAEDNLNPSTRLHILIDIFEKLSTPQPLL
ncbi:MAG: RloB family protein [Candidatus Nitrotoga sp.]|nr:RloB family protein [Candidatus Nitrotoga sp.]MDP1854915.1 RloB family protein [Candidatus Nitrotoga sp.]